MSDRGSWAILSGRRSPEEPVDRAGPVENAQSAFPTRALDGGDRAAHNAPQALVEYTQTNESR